MLKEFYINENFEKLFDKNIVFKPYPDITERSKWQYMSGLSGTVITLLGLLGTVTKDSEFSETDLKQKYIALAEQYIGYQWPSLPASKYMDFKRNGNRTRYEEMFFERRHVITFLAMAECIEAKGRFVDSIINLVWAICEESSWCFPAHQRENGNHDALPDIQDPVIDLFAAETAATLATVYYLLKPVLDKETEILCKRIKQEVEERIFVPFFKYNHNHWMGFAKDFVNNHTPWVNSNCLLCFLILMDDNERKIKALEKSMRSIDRFIEVYPEDGGCDEGPGYWTVAGAALFECLELLYIASNGKVDVFDQPLIQNIGKFIYRVHICDDYYINFADASTKVGIPYHLVYRYGKRINDNNMMNLAAASFKQLYNKNTKDESYKLYRTVSSYFQHYDLVKYSGEYPLLRDVWLNKIQVMAAREREGSSAGLYIAAKGGHNEESHNHNDIGNFVIYSDGKPAIIDVGVESYTAKTFSDRRYEIWTMQSSFHNWLPEINGVQQSNGKKFAAKQVSYIVDDSKVELSMDISSAYPEEAGIKAWEKVFTYYRWKSQAEFTQDESIIEIRDSFSLSKPTDNIKLALMTCCKYELVEDGIIILHVKGGRNLEIKYDKYTFDVSAEKYEINDEKLLKSWEEQIYRIVFTVKGQVSKAIWNMKISSITFQLSLVSNS